MQHVGNNTQNIPSLLTIPCVVLEAHYLASLSAHAMDCKKYRGPHAAFPRTLLGFERLRQSNALKIWREMDAQAGYKAGT